MKMFSKRMFRFLRVFVLIALHIAHPVIRVSGKENIPDGPAVVCCNHSSFSDPIYVVVCSNLPVLPRTMAKKELLRIPFLGWLYQKLGAFPVDRSGADVGAIKTAMKTLRDGDKLMIFPEGTRIRNGKKSEPHNGAMMIATRMQTPVLPVYLTSKKKFLHSLDLVFGEPYMPQTAGKRATEEELNELTADLMKRIYGLGEGL